MPCIFWAVGDFAAEGEREGMFAETCEGEVFAAPTDALLDTNASLGVVDTGRGAGRGVKFMTGWELCWLRCGDKLGVPCMPCMRLSGAWLPEASGWVGENTWRWALPQLVGLAA